MNHLSERSVKSVSNPIVVAGQATTTGAAQDCAGFEAVCWDIPITTSLDMGTLAFTVHHADTDAGYVATTLTKTITDAGGGQYNGKVQTVELHRPAKRFNKLVIVTAVANGAFGAGICTRHRSITSAPTQVSGAPAILQGVSNPSA